VTVWTRGSACPLIYRRAHLGDRRGGRARLGAQRAVDIAVAHGQRHVSMAGEGVVIGKLGGCFGSELGTSGASWWVPQERGGRLGSMHCVDEEGNDCLGSQR
jgi:hypothetical protein